MAWTRERVTEGTMLERWETNQGWTFCCVFEAVGTCVACVRRGVASTFEEFLHWSASRMRSPAAAQAPRWAPLALAVALLPRNEHARVW